MFTWSKDVQAIRAGLGTTVNFSSFSGEIRYLIVFWVRDYSVLGVHRLNIGGDSHQTYETIYPFGSVGVRFKYNSNNISSSVQPIQTLDGINRLLNKTYDFDEILSGFDRVGDFCYIKLPPTMTQPLPPVGLTTIVDWTRTYRAQDIKMHVLGFTAEEHKILREAKFLDQLY